MFLYVLKFDNPNIIKIGISANFNRPWSLSRLYWEYAFNYGDSMAIYSNEPSFIVNLESEILALTKNHTVPEMEELMGSGYTEFRDGAAYDMIKKKISRRMCKMTHVHYVDFKLQYIREEKNHPRSYYTTRKSIRKCNPMPVDSSDKYDELMKYIRLFSSNLNQILLHDSHSLVIELRDIPEPYKTRLLYGGFSALCVDYSSPADNDYYEEPFIDIVCHENDLLRLHINLRIHRHSCVATRNKYLILKAILSEYNYTICYAKWINSLNTRKAIAKPFGQYRGIDEFDYISKRSALRSRSFPWNGFINRVLFNLEMKEKPVLDRYVHLFWKSHEDAHDDLRSLEKSFMTISPSQSLKKQQTKLYFTAKLLVHFLRYNDMKRCAKLINALIDSRKFVLDLHKSLTLHSHIEESKRKEILYLVKHLKETIQSCEVMKRKLIVKYKDVDDPMRYMFLSDNYRELKAPVSSSDRWLDYATISCEASIISTSIKGDTFDLVFSETLWGTRFYDSILDLLGPVVSSTESTLRTIISGTSEDF